ncbi:hypothetical protein ACTQ5K_22890 [Niallia sp. Sow4_A1]|jgi:hypothetical protein|uniref:hypothetical protein n=1 Tax=unclassified Niallia TaxID=2837522 RepID=UPI0020424062|nr:hypothetical protein [Niallia sp. MER TA 168]MCM3364992.1 hypothetical protein [Niallia sp. MER TA 168]
MDNELENLRKKMDSTVLKSIKFTKRHESLIYDAISNSSKNKQRFKLKMAPFISLSFISIICLSLLFLVKENFIDNTLNEDHIRSVNNYIYTPPIQEENYEELNKEEILTKMLNSIDYFDTASGTFELYYANSKTKINVDFSLSIREKSGGAINSKINVDGETRTIKSSYKDLYIASKPLSIKEYFNTDVNGEDVTESRWFPPIEEAANSLFPYDIASNYTRNLDDWEIESQNEPILGHNSLVIFGEMNNVEKSKATNFRFWVDKDSGILIKYETYNKSGDIIDYLHPSKLEVNKPVDISLFNNDIK